MFGNSIYTYAMIGLSVKVRKIFICYLDWSDWGTFGSSDSGQVLVKSRDFQVSADLARAKISNQIQIRGTHVTDFQNLIDFSNF